MKYSIEELTKLYLNKTLGSLTVKGVIKNERGDYYFLCICSCGIETTKSAKSVLSGHTKTCGCRINTAKRVDMDELTREYRNTTVNWLTIKEFRRLNNKINIICVCKCGKECVIEKKKLLGKSPPISCGCYRYSDEFKQIHKMSDETKRKISEKQKEFYIKNQDRKKYISERNKQLYLDEPWRKVEVGQRISNWFKSNKEAVLKWAIKRKQSYKEHPEIGRNRSQLYKEHPEIIKKISHGNKRFCTLHNELVEQRNTLAKSRALLKRENADYTKLSTITYPEDVPKLLSGEIKVNDIIRTLCPCCNTYAPHKLNSIFILSRSEFKNGNIPLCKQCHINLTSNISSRYETDIANYIASFYSGNCIRNSREILNGKELDLYYPEKRIAVEFNGDFWHNENHKQKDYHYNKFKECLRRNILLVSVFEFYWIQQKEKVKSYLADLFTCVNNKLSFEKDKYMNNNYPAFDCIIDLENYNEDTYEFRDSLIYTCGYSRLVEI